MLFFDRENNQLSLAPAVGIKKLPDLTDKTKLVCHFAARLRARLGATPTLVVQKALAHGMDRVVLLVVQ